MLIDWFTVCCASAQLPHPGVVVEAISLQAHSSALSMRGKSGSPGNSRMPP